MKSRFWALGLVLVVVLMLIVPQTMAQDSATDTVEFTGEITAIENDGISQLLTISGFTVDATGAEINVVLAVATRVKVEGVLLDDGTVDAREIGVPEIASDSSPGNDSPDDELELVGSLDSLTANVAVVSGVSFNVAGAQVQTGLALGDTVKVHANFDAVTGNWIARELEAFSDDDNDGLSVVAVDELELIGVLDSLNGGVAMINGTGFDVTGAEIKAGVVPGSIVKVHASFNAATQTWIARELELFAGDDSDDDGSNDDSSDDSSFSTSSGDEMEMVGMLGSFGGGMAVIDGMSFDVTRAEIKVGVVSGAIVKVHASFNTATQTWIARELELFDGDDRGGDDDSRDDSNDDNSGRGSDDDGSDGNSGRGSGICEFEIEVGSANLRSGPGTGYDVIGFAFDGDDFAVQEVHASGAWIKLAAAGGEAWVAVSTGELDGDCSGLAVSNTQFVDDDDSDDDDDRDDRDDSRDDSDDDSNDDSDDDSDDDNSGSGSNDDSDDDNSGSGSNDDDDDSDDDNSGPGSNDD